MTSPLCSNKYYVEMFSQNTTLYYTIKCINYITTTCFGLLWPSSGCLHFSADFGRAIYRSGVLIRWMRSHTSANCTGSNCWLFWWDRYLWGVLGRCGILFGSVSTCIVFSSLWGRYYHMNSAVKSSAIPKVTQSRNFNCTNLRNFQQTLDLMRSY